MMENTKKMKFFTLSDKKKALQKVADGLGDLYGAIVFDAEQEEIWKVSDTHRTYILQIEAVDAELAEMRKEFTRDELALMKTEYDRRYA